MNNITRINEFASTLNHLYTYYHMLSSGYNNTLIIDMKSIVNFIHTTTSTHSLLPNDSKQKHMKLIVNFIHTTSSTHSLLPNDSKQKLMKLNANILPSTYDMIILSDISELFNDYDDRRQWKSSTNVSSNTPVANYVISHQAATALLKKLPLETNTNLSIGHHITSSNISILKSEKNL